MLKHPENKSAATCAIKVIIHHNSDQVISKTKCQETPCTMLAKISAVFYCLQERQVPLVSELFCSVC